MDTYRIEERNPTAEEHTRLRRDAGLSAFPGADVAGGLANSWFAVVACDDAGRAVGMGRMIGDGALFLHVVDMAVEPQHQGRGLGSRVLERLLEHADRHAPRAYISLVADPPGQRLYPRFGFADVAPSLGMRRVVPP